MSDEVKNVDLGDATLGEVTPPAEPMNARAEPAPLKEDSVGAPVPGAPEIEEIIPPAAGTAGEPDQTAQMAGNEPFGKNTQKLLVMAKNTIHARKLKKLEKILSLFTTHQKITNDDVEKLLHVSDATATRYLSILEKEGRIKQEGRTGKGVWYELYK